MPSLLEHEMKISSGQTEIIIVRISQWDMLSNGYMTDLLNGEEMVLTINIQISVIPSKV